MSDNLDSENNNLSARHAEDWLESKEQPSRDELYLLAQSGTPEDAEVLRNLAEKYNINNYDNPDNLLELADKIAQAIDAEDSSGS